MSTSRRNDRRGTLRTTCAALAMTGMIAIAPVTNTGAGAPVDGTISCSTGANGSHCAWSQANGESDGSPGGGIEIPLPSGECARI